MPAIMLMWLQGKDALTEKLKETEMLDIYNNVEIPLAYALYDGTGRNYVCRKVTKEYGERLKTGIDALERYFAEAGQSVPPKQSQERFYLVKMAASRWQKN